MAGDQLSYWLKLIDQLLWQYPAWGMLLFFCLAFGESLVVLSLFLPGVLLIALAGFLASKGYYAFSPLLLLLITGSFLGDLASYELGRHAGKWVKGKNHRWMPLTQIQVAEDFFRAHGGKSLIIGRFMQFVRSFIPLSAGLVGMPLRLFVIYDLAGAVIWTAGVYTAGYLLHESWRLVAPWVVSFGWVILLVVAGLGGFYALKKWRLARSQSDS